MSPEKQIIAIAEACGHSDRWVLKKRGLYYRPNAGGYTSHISDAWIVPEKTADQYVYPHDEPVTKHRAPPPDYLNDLNAMQSAIGTLDTEKNIIPDDNGHETQMDRFVWMLELVLERNVAEDAIYFSAINATAAQRAEAFLKTLGKWEEFEKEESK